MRCVDFVGYGLAAFLGWRRRKSERSLKNICVLRLDHLGDILMATAVPRALRSQFPDSRITFLTSSAGAALLKNHPLIDEVICYDAPWFLRGRTKQSELSFWGLAGILRKKQFDLAIGLRGDLRENALLFFSGIPLRAGYGITGGGFFLNREVFYRNNVHETEHYRDILKALGCSAVSLEPEIHLTPEEESAFEIKMPSLGLSAQKCYGAALIDSGAASKEWPTQHWLIFLEKFKKNYPDKTVVLVGTNQKKLNEIRSKSSFEPIELVGKLSLRELCIFLNRCEFFVGADSGPSHVAAVLGVPALFLYSGTNEFERWKPMAKNAKVLLNKVNCSPCYLNHCPVEGHPCMAGIAPERVIEVIQSTIGLADRAK
jgi:ADP-heptose:LPS heptosyltransferase